MDLDQISKAIDQIASRIPAVLGKGEEATKQALVLPMIDVLGYDIWNPSEVCPEYDADFPSKKSGQPERVDYAVIVGEQPRIFIEVKAMEIDLSGHTGQLARYFNATPTVALGILTNGVDYRFYTDTGDPNIMDEVPFHSFSIEGVDLSLDVFVRFHKTVFSHEAIRDYATTLNYTNKIVEHMREQLDLRDRDPSESIIRWILAAENMYTGRVTANVVERFQPIVKTAIQTVLRKIVRRSIAAIEDGVSAPEPLAGEPDGSTAAATGTETNVSDPIVSDPIVEETKKRSSIVTTESELACFAIVKTIFDESEYAKREIYNPSARKEVPIEIAYKDTTAHFGIYLNKPSWWAMRISLDGRLQWVGFDMNLSLAKDLLPEGATLLDPSAFAPVRVAISKPEDLIALKPLILETFSKILTEQAELQPSGK